jgi:hypothetical protein
MMWSWPEIPAAWGYALTMASMILLWTLVTFGAIILVHYLGGENRPAVGRTTLPNRLQPADGPMGIESESVAAAGGVIGSLVGTVVPLFPAERPETE